MLHEFSMRNFYSFADEATVSFRVGEHAPDNELFFKSPSGERLSKLLAAIGPNACGKTNLMKGLVFLRWFMLDSFRGMEAKGSIPVDCFGFTEPKERDPVLHFRIVFEVENTVYSYALDTTVTRVLSEVLERKAESNHFNYLFRREWNEKTKAVEVREQGFGFDVSAVKALIENRHNATLFSALRQIQHPQLQPLAVYLEEIETNVDRWGRDTAHPIGQVASMLTAAEFFHQHKDYREEMTKLMTEKLDFGVHGIAIKEEKIKDQNKAEPDTVYVPYGVHRVAGKEYGLPLMMESSGTQNSFLLLLKLLPVLHAGGLAVIDEFEVDLHPQMIPPILDLFISPETNPKNAQLLFSTHALEVFRKLDKTQVLLVEKDQNSRSHVCRLDDIKGVRRDVDLYAKYMSGAFGAVPNV